MSEAGGLESKLSWPGPSAASVTAGAVFLLGGKDGALLVGGPGLPTQPAPPVIVGST